MTKIHFLGKCDENSDCTSVDIYMFKINNGNTRTMCEICSKLTLKTQNEVTDVVLMALSLALNIF